MRDVADFVRVDVEAREWERVEAKARVRENVNAVKRSALEARKVKGRNTMLQGRWQ